MNYYLLLRLLHLVGAFLFVAAHGATAAVTFKLRSETDPNRVRTMLELSRSTRGVMYVSFLLMVGAGVALGFVGAWWWAGWIWVSLGLFLVLFGAAFPLAIPYFRQIRLTLERDPVDRDELRRLLRSPRLLVLAWVETIGIAFILWLMVYKPF
jgi:uncharacterized membrane protein